MGCQTCQTQQSAPQLITYQLSLPIIPLASGLLYMYHIFVFHLVYLMYISYTCTWSHISHITCIWSRISRIFVFYLISKYENTQFLLRIHSLWHKIRMPISRKPKELSEIRRFKKKRIFDAVFNFWKNLQFLWEGGDMVCTYIVERRKVYTISRAY